MYVTRRNEYTNERFMNVASIYLILFAHFSHALRRTQRFLAKNSCTFWGTGVFVY